MGYPNTSIGIDITTVSTTPLCPLGTKVVEPPLSGSNLAGRGEKLWVYVFNDEASTAFAEGHVVKRDPSAATEDFYGALLTAGNEPAMAVLGVAQHAIPAGSYGFVLCKGIGEVLVATAGVTADSAIVPDTVAGAVEDMAGTEEHSVIGLALEAVSAGSLATCYINCVGA